MDGFDDDEWDDFASSPMPTAAESEGGGGEGDGGVFSGFQAPAPASAASVGAAEPAELLLSGDMSSIDAMEHAEQMHAVEELPAAGIPAVVPEELPAAVPAIEDIIGEPLSVRGEADVPVDALLPEDRAAAHSEAAEPEAPVEAFVEAPAAAVEEVSAEVLEDVLPGTGPMTEAEDLVPSQDDEARQAVEVDTTATHVLDAAPAAAPEEVPVQHPVDIPVSVNTAAEVPAVAVDPFEGEDWDFTSPPSAAAPADLVTLPMVVQQPAAVAADSVPPVLAAEAPLTASAAHAEDLPIPIVTLSSAADPATAPVDADQAGSADADAQFTAPAPSDVVPEPVAEMGAVIAFSEDALQGEPAVLASADIASEVVDTTMAVETAAPDGEDWDVSAARVATEHGDQAEVPTVAVDAAALVLDAAPEEVEASPVPAADDWDDFAAPAQPAESEASVPSPGANVVEPTEVDILPADAGETGSALAPSQAQADAQTVDSAEGDAASHELGDDVSDEWDFAAAPATEAVPVDVPVPVDSAAEMPAASAAVSAVDLYEGDDWDFSSSPSSAAAPVDLTAVPVVDQQSPALAATVDPLRMLELDSASPVPPDATEVPSVADPSDADKWGGFAEPAPTAAVPEPAAQDDADDWDDFAAPAAVEEVEAEALPSVAAPTAAPEEVEEFPVPATDADDWDDFAAPAQPAEPQAADPDEWDGFAAAPPAAIAATVPVPAVSAEEAEEDWDAFTSSTSEVTQEIVQAKVAVAQQDEDDWDAFTAADHTATVSAASALPVDLPAYSRWFIETVQGVVQNADTNMLLSLLAAQSQTDGLFLPSQEHHIPVAKLVNISFVSATSEEVPLSAVAAWTLQATEDILGQFVPEDLLSLEELEHHLGRHVQLPEVKEVQAAPPASVAPPQASPQAPRASPQTSPPQRAPPSAQQAPVPPPTQPSPVVPVPSQTPTPSAVVAFLQSLPDLGYVLQVRQ